MTSSRISAGAPKSALLAGASGLVGSRLVHHLLQHADIGRVTAIGRRPLALKHNKLVSKVADLGSASAIALEIPDDAAAFAFCSLGTTMKQAGSKEAFHAVDFGAVVAFGEACLRKGVNHFLLVSSLGADRKAGNFYLRTKAEAEDALTSLGFPRLTIVRPSFLDDEGQRRDSRLGEKIALPLARAVFSLVGKTSRYAPVTADVVARALVALAFDNNNERRRVIESDQLHRLGA